MATITKQSGKKGTTYKARIRIKGCPEICKTFRRKTDATQWAKSRESALLENRDFPEKKAGNRTVKDAIDRYLIEGFARKPGSKKKQSSQLNWWADQIGHLLLTYLNPEDICDARYKLEQGTTRRGGGGELRNSATVNRYMSAISAVLTAAVSKWHWMTKNPIIGIPQLSENKGRTRFLSKKELLRLTKACKQSKNRLLLPLFLLAVATGVRKGEALQLTWDDIDFDRRTVYIRITKNGEPRTLPLEGAVWEEINELSHNRRPDSELLFPGRDPSKPMDYSTAWKYALSRAKISDFKWHDNRHTTGSYLAMSGATLAEIADILGHKTIIVAKRYSHHTDEHKRRKLTAMNQSHIPDDLLTRVEKDDSEGEDVARPSS